MKNNVRVLNEQIRDLTELDEVHLRCSTVENIKGYVFHFVDSEIVIAVSNLKESIHSTKSVKDCILGGTSWDSLFYAKYADNTYLSREHGLDEDLVYLLIKKVSEALQLTLNMTLDKDRMDDILRNQKEMDIVIKMKSKLERQRDSMTRDKELLALFKERFDLADFVVINHFLWAMGSSTYQPSFIIDTVEDVWEDLALGDKNNMTMYLALVSKYVEERVR